MAAAVYPRNFYFSSSLITLCSTPKERRAVCYTPIQARRNRQPPATVNLGRLPPYGISTSTMAETILYYSSMDASLASLSPHCRTGDEVKPERFALVAEKIKADPALLEIPLANIARWLARGHSAAARLEQWRAIVLQAKASDAGMSRLLDLLRDQSAEAVFFKEYAPFPGVLTPAELDLLSWTSAH